MIRTGRVKCFPLENGCPYMMATLDGERVNLDENFVNLLLYGYGVYSSFVVSDGKMVVGWDYHVQRIQSDALNFLGLTVERERIANSVHSFIETLDASGPVTCRITIFPGDFNLGAPHAAKSPRLLVTGRSGSSLSGKPLALTLTECDRPYAQHKITNIGAAMKRRAEAKAAGYDDALFLAGDRITEGPTWNILFISQDKVITPPSDGHLLPGVTRRLLMEILGSQVEEGIVQDRDLPKFDGALVSNSAIGVVPVRSIGDTDYSCDNPLISTLQKKYQAYPKSVLS